MNFDHNFGKCRPISKILHCQISEEVLHTHIMKILHVTLNMFLH